MIIHRYVGFQDTLLIRPRTDINTIIQIILGPLDGIYRQTGIVLVFRKNQISKAVIALEIAKSKLPQLVVGTELIWLNTIRDGKEGKQLHARITLFNPANQRPPGPLKPRKAGGSKHRQRVYVQKKVQKQQQGIPALKLDKQKQRIGGLSVKDAEQIEKIRTERRQNSQREDSAQSMVNMLTHRFDLRPYEGDEVTLHFKDGHSTTLEGQTWRTEDSELLVVKVSKELM